MGVASYGVSLSAGGTSIQQTIQRSGDGVKAWEVTLPVAEQGNLSTRTSDSVGTITMDSGSHGIQTGETIDIYWTISGVDYVRYGVTVGTVSGDSVPITGGSGDVLPVATTVVRVAEQESIVMNIDGDNIQIIGIVHELPTGDTAEAHVDFQDSGSASIEEVTLVPNSPQVHDIVGGATNVFTGNPIESCQASNGSLTNAGTLKVISVEDATP